MKLKDIKTKIYDNVCLYKKNEQFQEDFDYEDLWKGKGQDIPDEFLDLYVCIIGARRKGILDIELRESESSGDM